MKRNRIVALILALVMAAAALVSCSKTQEEQSSVSSQQSSVSSEKAYTVGVIQFGSHPSLDNCFAGVEQALKASELNITIDRQDGNFDSATCDTIAKNMVSKNYDLIIAIATPAAVSAYSAAANTTIPVVFCAVSDPVAAGLVDSLEQVGGNCTGTSDILDLAAQVEMIQAMQPELNSIGVLYTTSEANSVSQLARLKEIAEEKDIEIVEQGVQSAADIPQAAASLAAKVDCINNFTDNNVVNNLSVVLEQANAAGIPVYGSEEEQVVNGCMASIGLDYIALGRVTGDMALEILGGADASSMAVKTITETTPFINKSVMERFEIALPEAYADATFVDAE